MPVSVREAIDSVRGTSGMPSSCSPCATRCASSACTPGQRREDLARCGAPRAAGSRACAAATSRRTSPSTRDRVAEAEHRAESSGRLALLMAYLGARSAAYGAKNGVET